MAGVGGRGQNVGGRKSALLIQLGGKYRACAVFEKSRPVELLKNSTGLEARSWAWPAHVSGVRRQGRAKATDPVVVPATPQIPPMGGFR